MRVLITGANGFVGKYLSKYLLQNNYEVWGTTRESNLTVLPQEGINFITLDLSDEEAIVESLNRIKPKYIFHIAGQSSVRISWDQKVNTFNANVNNTICLLEAIVKSEVSATARVLTVGSSEEYGRVSPESMPIDENTGLNPISPYGISKATVYMLAQHYYHSYGLQIIHARPFNHIGAGQGLGFVTSDFAYQVAQIEEGRIKPIIRVGNLSGQRDFLDVRDIVKSYTTLIARGTPGQVYNICSGSPVKIRAVLDFLVLQSSKSIEIITSPELLRPVDIPLYIGSNEKLKRELAWSPNISIEDSLTEIYNYWLELTRNKVKEETK